jgi:hypothetical protein
MPNVTGTQLDVALNEIKAAGFPGDVEIIGGGAFGVVKESNWTVCTQAPVAGGRLANPKLTVNRKCPGSAVESSTPIEGSTGVSTTVATEPTAVTTNRFDPAGKILNATNSRDLAAILVEADHCADSIQAFASNHRDQIIEFDGHIADVSLHAGRDTRWDFLIAPGNAPGGVGPAFKFEDVGRLELHLTDDSIPSLKQGDNLHIVARVLKYNPAQCLFFLEPVATGPR